MITHMYERKKLDEAQFFLNHLRLQRESPVEYRYHLSAFLNAGRSVLQYAIEENQITAVRDGKSVRIWATPAAQAWYDGWARDPVIGFLKDVRDDNIHVAPVEPDHKRAVMMGSPGAIRLKPSAPGDTKLEVESFVPTGPMGEPFTVRIEFREWNGPEDVTTLCEQYVKRLDDFISDGVQQGFLKSP